MHGSRGDPDLTTLWQRLALGLATARRPRGLAVLAVHVHPPAGEAAAPIGIVPQLHREVERRLRACLEPTDSLGTVAELAFVALLERADDGPFATHAADRIVRSVGSMAAIGATAVRVVASVGISVHPDDGDSVEELVRCAEAAAEAAEAGGGDLFGFFSQPLNVRAQRRARIERALAGALDNDELYLRYQPQIDTRDGTLVGAEALLRFESAAMGPVGPDEFIPVLEATGAIEEVGAWVLGRACEQAAAWERSGRAMRIGVNVSARQLGSPDFDEIVTGAVSRSGLTPSLLVLELTESVLVDNSIETRRRIDALRGRGIRIALDDFGTGYASLSYIRQLAVDELKIDRQFVRGLPLDPQATAITLAIVALARSLRLGIVAEGVETEAEEEFLHTLDCFVVQGFLHARPMRPAELDTWRGARPWT